MTSINQLQSFLATAASGPVADTAKVESLLCECWGGLHGSGFGGMIASKLLNRTENMTWKPPILEFQIARHRATVAGSVYAHVQTWRIDVQKGTADLDAFKKARLVGKRDKPLNVAPIADEIAKLMFSRENDARLKWLEPNRVRVEIGRVIPATNSETTLARRKRFRDALEERLQARGWHKVTGKVNTFARTT